MMDYFILSLSLSIHYFSRKTTVQQEKYSSYELEVLAIIEALKKFRSYLLGTKFKIITDCDAFQKTMHKKDLPTKIARWALMLEEFDYEVCHRPGRQMKQDDALSRYPIMMISSHDITQKIKEAQNKDEFISQLKSAIKITPSDEYSLKNEILYKLQRIMNSTTTRSTKFTPFEVLIGVKMKQKEDLQIKRLLEDELSEQFINKRETLRNEANENILRLQAENKKQYNKHRKPAYNYKPGDTVAIQRTQFGTGLKLRPKYFGPYEVTKVNKHDRYEVHRKLDNMKVQTSLVPSAEDGVVIRMPCGYQLLADHFRSHDRTEVTRGSQPRWRDSPLPAAISTR
ncbi:retrovirus-related Pol polyprotein from transposon 17.6 [Trichonephila clavipes]|nr:retrovirus-related Pol polyprotein from transposon 17.6 [Trichonephila clavipes]